jgi:hypothetical protein
LCSILSGLVLSLTELHENEIASEAEKKYKNLLNKKFKDYSQNMTKNLDELHQPDIDIDKLFDFFKD